jgi:hypothetical protein
MDPLLGAGRDHVGIDAESSPKIGAAVEPE